MKSNNATPLVTVITPTYNRAAYIEETVKSILGQNYKNIEYLVLDDGSTDDTEKVLRKYKDKLTYIKHKNMGEVRTVNKAFKLARGEIIGVINSDDPLLPGALSEIVSFMVKHPEKIVVYPDWKMIDHNGKTLQVYPTIPYSFEKMVAEHYCIPGPATFFRKIVVEKLNGRDLNFTYVSDYDFWLRAALIGDFARVPKVLATWRLHSGAATLKHKGLKMALEHIKVLNKFYTSKHIPQEIVNIKEQAYEKACESARICRGDSLLTKIIVFFVSIYYSPQAYLKLFFSYRAAKFAKIIDR